MIQGTSPLLIFKLYKENPLVWKAGETDKVDAYGNSLVGQPISLKDWQNMTEAHRDIWHTPIIIPIYLDEKIFKIVNDEATQDIKVNTTQLADLAFQSSIANVVTFQIRAANNNTLMMMLLSALKQVTQLLVNQHYSITLYWDSTFVLNGLFTSITQAIVTNTNEKIITMTISEVADETKEEESSGVLNNLANDDEFNPGV